MATPPHIGVKWGHCTGFRCLWDYPQGSGTYMDPPALSRRLQVKKNTFRYRCSHISGLLVKTSYGLRALMKSALPLLITTTASWALYLVRVGGSRSDRSCHHLDHPSHRAARLLMSLVKSNICA